MKKMNLIFHTRGIQGVISKGLMIFTMLFLFGFGFNTLNAQYVEKQEAINRLKQAGIQIVNNMDHLHKNGTATDIENAQFKQSVLKALVRELNNGSTVVEAVDYIVGNPNHTAHYDFQLLTPRGGQDNVWLIDEIKKLLEL